MAIVANLYTFVTWVDTHARSHTLAIVDASSGRELDTRTFPSTQIGRGRAARRLQRRCGDAHDVLVARQATNTYGATLRDLLSDGGYRVIEAPKPDRSLRRSHGKSDQLDAVRAAQPVLRVDVNRLTEAKGDPIEQALQILLTDPEVKAQFFCHLRFRSPLVG